MTRAHLFLAASLVLAPLAAPGAAGAHEFIVKPAATEVAAGAPLPIEILSSHVFMKGEEMEAASDVAAWVVNGADRTAIPLTADAPALAFRGTAAAPGTGGFIVSGLRRGQIWSLTPDGLKQGTPAQLPGGRRPMMVEKYAKALINGGPADESWNRVLGDRLEIVPTANPATLRPGQDLRVRILFDGQPLSTRVYATYDGFTDNPNSYAYFTETADDGTALVRVTQPGLWMVRVEQRAAEKAADHEQYLGRAVLVFRVKG